MVKQPIFGAKSIKGWTQWKNISPVGVYKILMPANKSPMIVNKFTEADVAKSWKDLKVMYLKFDQGLVKAIKKANSAGDDTDAVIALRELLRICDQYEALITKFCGKGDAQDFVGSALLVSLNDHVRTPTKDALNKLPTGKSFT